MKHIKSIGITVAIALIAAIAFIANIGSALSAWNQFIDWLQTYSDFPINDIPLRLLLFFIAVALVSLITLFVKRSTLKSDLSKDEPRIRSTYLKWFGKDIENRLKSSIHNARFLDLGLIEQADTVLPWTYRYQRSQASGQTGEYQGIDELFAHDERRILLLGAPGSGKSTTLLKLAEKLHERSVDDSDAEIPLLFNLSLWGQADHESHPFPDSFSQKKPLMGTSKERTPQIEDWLSLMLTETPGIRVTSEIAHHWIKERRVALLLDGLDEADETIRAKLVSELNEFLEKYPDMTVIICSRIADYEALVKTKSVKLLLDTAVTIQPLTSQQIDNYLEAAQASAIHEAFEKDPELQEMARVPLNLSLMVLAYGNGYVPSQLDTSLSMTYRRLHLFSAYVKAMMQRKARRDKANRFMPESDFFDSQQLPTAYKEEEVNRYLGWLAKNMSERSRTSLRFSNLYQFLWESGREDLGGVINISNGLITFFCTFLIAFFLLPAHSVSHSLGKSALFAGIILGLYFQFQWAVERFENEESPLNYVILFTPSWFVFAAISAFTFGGLDYLLVAISSFIFGDLNDIFYKHIVGGIMAIIVIIVANISILQEEDLSPTEFVSWNLYFISAITAGLFGIGKPGPHVAVFLTGIITGLVLIIGRDELETPNKIANAVLGGVFGAILGGMLGGASSIIGSLLFMVPLFIWGERIGRRTIQIIGNPLAKITLIAQGHIPLRLNHFLSYTCDTLLLKRSHNEYEFIHRRLRDYFAIRDIVPALEIQTKAQRLALTEELVKLKDASCDILLELIEDNDKQVRLSCIKGLGKIGSTIAAQTLIAIIKSTGTGIQEKAIEALAEVKDIGSVPLMIDILNTNDNTSVMYHSAIRALSRMNKLDAWPDIPELIRLIRQGNWNEQKAAVFALAKLGIIENTPDLIQLMKGKDGNVQRAAISALGELKAKEAVPGLIQLMDDEDETVQTAAISALGELKAKEAVPELLQLMKDTDGRVRTVAIFALRKITESSILRGIGRQIMAYTLGQLKVKKSLPKLKLYSLDSNRHVQLAAASALGKLDAKEAIPELITLAKHWDSKIQLAAVSALGKLDAEEAIPELITLVKNMEKGMDVRIAAASALEKLDAKEAIPELITLVKNMEKGMDVRIAAASALEKLDVKEAIPELITLAKHWDSKIQLAAASALKKLDAKEAIPELITLIKNMRVREDVRIAAVSALGKLGGEEAIPELTKLVKDMEINVRQSAVFTLQTLGVQKVMPKMICLMQDKNEHKDVRQAAVSVLGELRAEKAVPELICLMQDKNAHKDVRQEAVSVLGKLGAQEAVPGMVHLLVHDKQIQNLVAQALSRLDVEYTFKGLLELTHHPNADVRYAAVFALGEIGDGRAIARLGNLLEDEELVEQPIGPGHSKVCHAAEKALEQIGTPQAKKILDAWSV